VTSDLNGLAAHFGVATDLVIWTRRLEDAVDRYVTRLITRDTFDLMAHGSPEEVSRGLGAALPPWVGREALVADMEGLAAAVMRSLGCATVQARLELLDRDACRLFHVDRVSARLLTTYAGPGTQFLAHRDVMREGLGRGDNARVVRSGADIQELSNGWVGLFRGEREPAMRGRGVVHRSPPVRAPGQRRLVFKVQPAGEIAC
jgi:hypothetical protein